MISKSKMVLRGNHYYKYVCLWNKENRTKKQIPIKLAHKDDYDIALSRKNEVERIANQFKLDGKLSRLKDYEFHWNSETGRNQFKNPMTIEKGIAMFIKNRSNSRRNSTLQMYTNSLNHWLKYFTKNMYCEDIRTKHLIGFVSENKDNRSDTSINMDLRILRTLLYWLRDMGEITLYRNDIIFKSAFNECPINDDEPIYITEVEFKKIMDKNWCLLYTSKREWYKEVFQLYWDTGMRLSEPFKGIIDGNYLHIPKEVSKNGNKRDVRITPLQANTITRLQDIWMDNNMSSNHIRGYSKMFKKALRECGIDESKHFHCLRHSYALRRRLETNGNYQQVQKELGHKDVSVTQKYQRCDERKLKDDFPSLKAIIESLENREIYISSTMKTSTMKELKTTYPYREIN